MGNAVAMPTRSWQSACESRMTPLTRPVFVYRLRLSEQEGDVYAADRMQFGHDAETDGRFNYSKPVEVWIAHDDSDAAQANRIPPLSSVLILGWIVENVIRKIITYGYRPGLRSTLLKTMFNHLYAQGLWSQLHIDTSSKPVWR